MNEALAGMAAPISYVWDKKYVRPYESPWSVMRNFTLLNACCGNLRATLSLLDIGTKSSHRKTYFDPTLMTYLNISIDDKDMKRTMKVLLPRGYSKQFDSLRDIATASPSIISRKLKYCPVCMKSGYHSVLHQAGGVQHCFIHRDVCLTTYWKGEYVLGHHKEYEPLTDDEKSRRTYNIFTLRIRSFDLYSQDTFILPTEWEPLVIPRHPLNPHLCSGDIKDVLIVDGLSDRSYVENQAGQYILSDDEDLKKHLIYSAIYDLDEDIKALDDLAGEAFEEKDPKYPYEEKIPLESLDVVSYLVSRFTRNLLTGCTVDEMKLKEFDMFLSCEYDPNDSIENNIVFTCLITGVRWAHMAFSWHYYSYLYVNDLKGSGGFGIAPGRVTWHKVIKGFGILCAMAILKDYCSRIYRTFQNETERRRKISLRERWVFKKPAYVIEEKSDGRVNVYMLE